MTRYRGAARAGWLASLALAPALLLNGCAGSSAGYHARIRFVNTVTGRSGNLDVEINTVVVATNLGLGVQTPTMQHNIGKVRVRAVDSVTQATVIPSTEVNLGERDYTIALVGKVGDAGPTAPRVLAFESSPPDLTADEAPPPSAVRFIHLSPSGQSVLFRVKNTVLASGPLSYLNQSDYVRVPSVLFIGNEDFYAYTVEVLDSVTLTPITSQLIAQPQRSSFTIIYVDSAVYAYQDP